LLHPRVSFQPRIWPGLRPQHFCKRDGVLRHPLHIDWRPEVLTKNKISPFYNRDLERILKEMKPDDLVVAGIMTNLCVRSAVSDAYDPS
jgi:nicotinamidase-related amidase